MEKPLTKALSILLRWSTLVESSILNTERIESMRELLFYQFKYDYGFFLSFCSNSIS